MLAFESSAHLSRSERIQLGGYYTPERLVELVFDYVQPHLRDDSVVLDAAAGKGAFIRKTKGDFRAVDCDASAIAFLKENFPKEKIFLGNSLDRPSRSKLAIPKGAHLIVVGNPPYNDTTSQFMKNQKGENAADPDLKSRDMGISFLKSYDKLQADVVCVLHPLSYLIKESNFRSLGAFKNYYHLKRAVIFSSHEFSNTGGTEFPVMAGLYLRGHGMSYETVRNFHFEILGVDTHFVLSDYGTIEGYVNKYPPRKGHPKISSIGLYFYTLRDTNALKRSAGFLSSTGPNSVVVETPDLYKYCYLYAYKSLFRPPYQFLYGNLSPLINIPYVESHKNDFIAYAFASAPALKKLPIEQKLQILRLLYSTHAAEKLDSIQNAEELGAITSRIKLHFTHLAMGDTRHVHSTLSEQRASIHEPVTASA